MESESPDHQSEFQQDSQEVPPSVKIDLTPEFQRNLRNLAKRYRSIRSDIQLVIQDLETGNFVGGRITGVGEDYDVLKVRVRNRDIQKGKSAGYRLIYQVESPTSVLLLSIYSKSDQADIATQEIWKILAEFYRDT
jgi:mRNA-degrading endonuclease RelE of RelBE toxin-antitoxin system